MTQKPNPIPYTNLNPNSIDNYSANLNSINNPNSKYYPNKYSPPNLIPIPTMLILILIQF